MENEDYTLGIDFGTTFSCMGVWENGSVIIIPNEINERITPSVVIFDNAGKIYVGEETINKVWKEDTIKIYEIKRLIGKKYSEVEDIINYFSYKVIKGKDDEILINMEFNNKKKIIKSPVEIAYLIFNKLITNAKRFLNKDINQVIITVPADFCDRQRDAIKSAAEMVKGIEVKKVINEPSAAVLSYGFPKKFMKKDKKILNNEIPNDKKDTIMHPMEEVFLTENIENKDDNADNEQTTSFKSPEEDLKIIVFDLGGGTYDVSLIEYGQSIFETLASAGNSRLGGGDFDNRLMEHCLNEFCNKNKDKNFSINDIKNNIKCNQRLKIACEQTKKMLSIKEEDSVFIEEFYKGETLNCKITRASFEKICSEDFKKLSPPIERVLSDSNIKPEDINEIVLVGGSSKIPKIKQILKEKFPNVVINDSINPEEAVAYGATIFGQSDIRKTGDFWGDFEYLDSIQHSYGIELDDGKMKIILPRGSKYPTHNTEFFFTSTNNQSNFEIKIYEGENEYAKDNEFLDEFIISGFPKKKKGEVCLLVTLAIDENQILKVTGHVGEGDIKKNVIVKRKRKQYVVNTLLSSNVSTEESKKEKQVKEEIVAYSKRFMNAKNDKEKLLLINKYNEAVIFMLNILEEKNFEIYFNFIERLFQSYAYLINSGLKLSMTEEEKKVMNINIKEYIKKIAILNPFKVKELLSQFKLIDKEKSLVLYNSAIVALDYLTQVVERKYFPLERKNNAYIAKNIYEECLSIADEIFCLKDKQKNEDILLKLHVEYKIKFDDIVDKCKQQILLIAVKFLQGTDYTKQSGRLMANIEKLDAENLALISSNFSEAIKILDDVNELNNNKEILELGSIGYANFVKIESCKDQNRLDLERLLNYANKSIKMAENSGENQNNKEWFKEIVKLKNELEKKLAALPAPKKKDLQNVRDKLENQFFFGNKELIQYLLKNYPIEGYQNSEEKMKDFTKNEKMFMKKLISAYKKASKFIIDSNEDEENINENFEEIKQIILEYINNMMNRNKNQ